MTLPPASIFEGTEQIIARALELKPNEALKHKSVCHRLRELIEPPAVMDGLVSALYSQIENNWSGRIPSQENWRLERQTTIGLSNTSPEVLLERAIAILGERGILAGWYNQIPVASGYIDHRADKRAAIDLIHHDDAQLDLIELKWESDTPLYAAFEVLRYGLAYLFAYQNKSEFGYDAKELLKAKRVSLWVLAPWVYFEPYDLGWLETELDRQLSDLAKSITDGNLAMGFRFLSFPKGFTLPFERGDQVQSLWEATPETPMSQLLLVAIKGIRSAWPENMSSVP